MNFATNLPCRYALAALAGLALLPVLVACGWQPQFQHYQGEAMGTYVAVTYGNCAVQSGVEVGSAITAELEGVDGQMSNWRVDSALSRFNNGPAGQWVAVPRPLAEVVALALDLSHQSAGAFDVTVGPLVDLWGFGPNARRAPPNAGNIQTAMQYVGYRSLQARLQPPALRKQQPSLRVDLSAIGKGHGVDRVAAALLAFGCKDYLVDIGGEARAAGLNPQGRAWRIGVERPDGSGLADRVLALSAAAVATSGDYRNFRMEAGRRLSHTLDPRTGRPVDHRLASVTVVAPSAAQADGLATLINVLGPKAGLRFAAERGIAALLISRPAQGRASRFEESYTAPMGNYFLNGP